MSYQNFFRDVDTPLADEIDGLSKLMYQLRESRREILTRYAVDSEEALLDAIHGARLAEHPAYDDYLSARQLQQQFLAVRDEMTLSLEKA
ncbi:hypothetical protein [Pseudogulbenkiania subflava]|uniref:Uncharacterized protein n=1 Tax=Pseudogulbenkiania subflava DSM 22618 TaxID=1123014 RepID=A0A1Y6BFW1_9NEIS|nr:hypothetical protein [Pseudogulbenkiania subflava]SMF01361.1 hypothetical protein SAMN02745746_00715 [Pseudogulbenkiania subflava DSM 22618]